MVNKIVQRTLVILGAMGIIGMFALALILILIKGFILVELMGK